MSNEALEKKILESLSSVNDPEIGRDIVSLGMVKDIKICGGAVAFTVELTTPACPLKAEIEGEIRKKLSELPEIKQLDVRWGAQVRRSAGAAVLSGSDFLKKVKNTIAVSSGKGGVGKSTVAVNLAAALAMDGARVGLMDLDVWGPNVPLMIGASGPPKVENGKIVPLEKYGMRVLSIGFLLKEGQPVVWRGPMVHHLIQQFTNDVDWGDLDYLVADLPPGTGDVQLSLAQSIPMTGAVLVSTPQGVSISDVTKAIAMFRMVKVPILGVIENMSYYLCPGCGDRADLFGHGGARQMAERLGTPFLGEIPLDIEIRNSADEGVPIVVKDRDGPRAGLLRGIARRLAGVASSAHYGELREGKAEGFLERLRLAFPA